MATFVVSTIHKGEYFGCMIHKIDTTIKNPEIINDYIQDSKMLYSAKSRISKQIYPCSTLRNINLHSRFNDSNTRFNVEFGVYAALRFIECEVKPGDNIVVANAQYVNSLVRGAFEIIEDFEAELIGYCYKHNVLFANTAFRCGLNVQIDTMKASSYLVSNPYNYKWIN